MASGEEGSSIFPDILSELGIGMPPTSQAVDDPSTQQEEPLVKLMKTLWKKQFDASTLPGARYLSLEHLVRTIRDNSQTMPIPSEIAARIPYYHRQEIVPVCVYTDDGSDKQRIVFAACAQDRTTGNVVDRNGLILKLEDAIVRDTKVKKHRMHVLLLTSDDYDRLIPLATNTEKRDEYLNVITPEKSATHVYHAMLRKAFRIGASDIHIEIPSVDAGRIRYRKDGSLVMGDPLTRELVPSLVSLIKAQTKSIKIEERNAAQDGGIHFTRDGLVRYFTEEAESTKQTQDESTVSMKAGWDALNPDTKAIISQYLQHSLRVSVIPALYGEEAVLRIIQATQRKFDLRDLGFSSQMAESIGRLVSAPKGLIIVTGPTGSGKTTTLYSILEGIKSIDKKIVTIEHPIEMAVTGTTQTTVNETKGYTFATALRTFVRQDPDVMLIGEIRDAETAKMAMQAANTGHLVFSTLHTNDSIYSLLRLRELGIDPTVVATSLTAVISQRLVRLSCQNCAETYDARDELNQAFAKEVFTSPVYLKRGTGKKNGTTCTTCEGFAYKGRSVIPEIWVIGDTERDMILEGTNRHKPFLDMAISKGMTPLYVAAMDMIMDGRTTLAELRSEAITPDDFLTYRQMLVDRINTYKTNPQPGKSSGPSDP